MQTGEKIKKLRKSLGLSQEELAEMVGLKKAAINKYETGRVVNIKRSVLVNLARALHVSAADLLDDDPNVKENEELYSDNKIFCDGILQLDDEDKKTLFTILSALLDKEKYQQDE